MKDKKELGFAGPEEVCRDYLVLKNTRPDLDQSTRQCLAGDLFKPKEDIYKKGDKGGK